MMLKISLMHERAVSIARLPHLHSRRPGIVRSSTSLGNKASKRVRLTRPMMANPSSDDSLPDPFQEPAGEDDTAEALTWLNAAITRWEADNLDEYAFRGLQGKQALIAAVSDIYEFADANLMELESNTISQIRNLFQNAERKLRSLKKIVNGVNSASTAVHTVSSALGFFGSSIGTGLGLANAAQKRATKKEIDKRTRALTKAVDKLTEMDVESLDTIEDFNEALQSLSVNFESDHTPIREGAHGFVMCMYLARVTGTSFEVFMNELSQEYVKVTENFEKSLSQLQSLETDPDFPEMGQTVERLVDTAMAQSHGLQPQVTAVAYGLVLHRKLSNVLGKAPLLNLAVGNKLDLLDRAGLRFNLTKAFNSVTGSTGFKVAENIATQLGIKPHALLVVGYEVHKLKEGVKEFNRLEKALKNSRRNVESHVSKYVDALEDSQEELDL